MGRLECSDCDKQAIGMRTWCAEHAIAAESMSQRDRAETAERELAECRAALGKIDAIRNDIVGTQSIHWSRHIYPLVAALGEAGLQGVGYDVARTKAVEEFRMWSAVIADRDALSARVRVVEGALRGLLRRAERMAEACAWRGDCDSCTPVTGEDDADHDAGCGTMADLRTALAALAPATTEPEREGPPCDQCSARGHQVAHIGQGFYRCKPACPPMRCGSCGARCHAPVMVWRCSRCDDSFTGPPLGCEGKGGEDG